MNKAILLVVVILVLFAFCGGPKSFELTEVDIIKEGLKVNSDNLLIRGINVNMKLSKALDVLKSDESQIKSDPFDDEYSLSPEPGFSIEIKKDIETIKQIRIYKDFEGLKGKTRLFYELQTKEAVDGFLFKHFGKPQEIKDISLKGLGIGFDFVYPGGVTFRYAKEDNQLSPNNQIVIQPVSLEPGNFPSKKPDQPKLSIIDLRKVHWGMTKEQVKETEKQTAISKGDDSIYYKEILFEFPVILTYFFKGTRLIGATYIFSQEHPDSNLNEFINDFNKVKEALIKEYGKPKLDTYIWKNSVLTKLYKKDPKKHGFAVKLGELNYIAEWENERTSIMLSMNGNKVEIILKLSFDSKKEIVDKL